jgi:hypothetical protein
VGEFVTWWHHGCFEVHSKDKIFFTAQLFATRRSDMGSYGRTLRKSLQKKTFRRGNLHVHLLETLEAKLPYLRVSSLKAMLEIRYLSFVFQIVMKCLGWLLKIPTSSNSVDLIVVQLHASRFLRFMEMSPRIPLPKQIWCIAMVTMVL